MDAIPEAKATRCSCQDIGADHAFWNGYDNGYFRAARPRLDSLGQLPIPVGLHSPDPDLIGWEENSHPIKAIKLVKPKPGVFVKEIAHLIVVVTNVEMILLGVATQTTTTGAKSVALYNTRMSIPVRGISVTFVVGSEATGRLFFVGDQTDDIYEFQYQQEEGWFRWSHRTHLPHAYSTFFRAGEPNSGGTILRRPEDEELDKAIGH